MRPFLFCELTGRAAELLLHWRVGRLIWVPKTVVRRRARILHPVRRSESIAAARVGAINLIVQIRSSHHSESHLLLIRSRDQQSTIHGWIIDKLPLIVFFLFIEDADRWILAEAGDSYNGRTAEGHIAKAPRAAAVFGRAWGIGVTGVRSGLAGVSGCGLVLRLAEPGI